MAIKILIDPGHYQNYNAGAVSGYYEGNIVWALAGYLIAELKEYGFQVGCTKKTINDYPKTSSGGDYIYKRGYMAQGYNLFLSLHTNSCDTESVDRAVIIPQLDESGAALGKKIGAVCKSVIGLDGNVQVFTRKGSSGGEYYGVLRGAKAAGVCGIIIEHTFHSHKASCRWLMVNEQLKKLAVAEAAAIADYYGYKKENDEMASAEYTELLGKLNALISTVNSGLTEVKTALSSTTAALGDADSALKQQLTAADKTLQSNIDKLTDIAGTGSAGSKWADSWWAEAVAEGLFAGDGEGNDGRLCPITREAAAVPLVHLARRVKALEEKAGTVEDKSDSPDVEDI